MEEVGFRLYRSALCTERIHSSSKDLLNTHCVPGIPLDTKETAVNKTVKILTLMELTSEWRERVHK